TAQCAGDISRDILGQVGGGASESRPADASPSEPGRVWQCRARFIRSRCPGYHTVSAAGPGSVWVLQYCRFAGHVTDAYGAVSFERMEGLPHGVGRCENLVN